METLYEALALGIGALALLQLVVFVLLMGLVMFEYQSLPYTPNR